MEWSFIEKGNAAGAPFEIAAEWVGADLLVCIKGGTKPHIGCSIQAVYRPSLSGDGSASATSSVWNLTGHKDELICRPAAEKICALTGRTVVCTGGFHIDNLTKEEIGEVAKKISAAVEALAEQISFASCEKKR